MSPAISYFDWGLAVYVSGYLYVNVQVHILYFMLVLRLNSMLCFFYARTILYH
jgi:hypothetical protein